MKKRIIGLGGVFFKCKDPQQTKEWYERHLGIPAGEYGAVFEARKGDQPERKIYTAWSTFPDKTTYFEPSEKEFMINYRVENLSEVLEELRSEDVQVVGEIQEFEYGKFAHIMDCEGNKIELWEPFDDYNNEMNKGNTVV